MLKDQFQYYLDHQDELVAQYNGKFLVIKDLSVAGVFDSQDEAYKNSIGKFEAGTFLIQQCAPGKDNYTQIFHSRVINSFVH